MKSSNTASGGATAKHTDNFIYKQDARCILTINPGRRKKRMTFSLVGNEDVSFTVKINERFTTIFLSRASSGAVRFSDGDLAQHEVTNNNGTAIIGFHLTYLGPNVPSRIHGLDEMIEVDVTFENSTNQLSEEEINNKHLNEQLDSLDEDCQNDLNFFKKCVADGFGVCYHKDIKSVLFMTEFNDLATKEKLYAENHHTRVGKGKSVEKTAWVDTAYNPKRTAKKLMDKPTIKDYFLTIASHFQGSQIFDVWVAHYDFAYDEQPKGGKEVDSD
jgi:hypothetical protein